MIEAARQDLLSFATLTKASYESTWFHEIIARKLESALHRAMRGEKVRIILTIPPRHGKSELASIRFPAWAIGKYPGIEFILSSYGAELSEKMGMKTRDVIASPEYQAIFPGVELRPDMKSKSKWMTSGGGSFLGVGIGSSVTGSGANCVVPYCTVSTEAGDVPIRQIRPGDKILGYDHSRDEVSLTEVRAVSVSAALKGTVRIGALEITEDHRVYERSKGYVSASGLAGGDQVMLASASFEDVATFGVRPGRAGHGSPAASISSTLPMSASELATEHGLDDYVVDIQTDTENFFCEGILVHNCILIDDPHKDRAEAESAHMRDTVWEYYRDTLYSRLEGFGAVVLIMQRWHTDDLVGRVLEQSEKQRKAGEPYDEWEVINFPAIAEEDEYHEGVLVRRAGEPLWPSKFPLPILENIRAASLYKWSSQYMQQPISSETQEFREHMFKRWAPGDLDGKYLRHMTFVDPAISQKREGDNTVVLTIAKEVDGPNIYRVREDAGHFTPAQTVDLVFKHAQDFRSDVWIETVAYQQALKFAVEEEQRRRQTYFMVNSIRSSTNKETRIRGLLPLYAAGVIHHSPTDHEYEREALVFPKGKRDDRVDCMSFMLLADMRAGSGAKRFIPNWSGHRLRRGR